LKAHKIVNLASEVLYLTLDKILLDGDDLVAKGV